MQKISHTLSSESVSEGHPDKVCDYISDSILDAYLAQDVRSRVACETLCKNGMVVLAGEITSSGTVDHEAVVRQAVREIGYTEAGEPFEAETLTVHQFLTQQASDIQQGVDSDTSLCGEQGAGDQGMMFGYATDETPELMPLPILLAHRLTRGLADDRRSGKYTWIRPDAKSQVSVVYDNGTPEGVSTVLVSTQHNEQVTHDEIRDYVVRVLAPRALGAWFNDRITVLVNPTGRFCQGGPSADCGVTGRKIIVDTYGGASRHGGGAFSGKDPSKVDRSGAYFCRYVARQVVKAGLARRAEIQVAYAIGVAQPVSIKVDTFGTGDEHKAHPFVRHFDFRPAAIIEQLSLLQPIYRRTTNYGHFGKPGLPWEN
jgi:S-adenosylmethionine synthetase